MSIILAAACLPGFGAFEVAVRGKPPSVRIVVPEQASSSQTYAAEELAAYVAKLTEVRLEIVSATAEKLKDNRMRTVRLVTADPKAELGESGFRLRTQGEGSSSALVIEGSAERGCLYGVYELLERFGGVRWYASAFEKVPRLETLAVPSDLDITEKPAFAMREPFWLDVSRDPAFAARCKVNTFSRRATPVDAKYGGDAYRFGRKLGSCHTLRTLLPWETYFKDHPEYFALVDGKRRGGYNEQVCLTHPDVLRIVLSNLLEHIRRDPDARFYGVSQNDSAGDNGCQCAKCLAVDAEECSRAGTYVRFINAIAEAVEKEFPGVLIETLAYRYTRKPPKKTRLRHNVVPCLCTIECDFAHPIATGTYPENVSFREDIRGWAAQTDQLYVWDYVTNFRHYMGTFPNGRVLQDNLKFFRDNKVKMIFEQGDYQGDHGDFAELKAWLIAKLSWNPDQPLDPLLDDFFNGYYGKAAKYVRADYDALAAAYAAKPDVPLSIYDDLDLAAVPETYYDEALARRYAALARSKDDPIHAANVRAWAFTVAYTRAYRFHKLPPDRQTSPVERDAALRCAREAIAEIDAHPDWFLSEAFGKWIGNRRSNCKKLCKVVAALEPSSQRRTSEEHVLRRLANLAWRRNDLGIKIVAMRDAATCPKAGPEAARWRYDTAMDLLSGCCGVCMSSALRNTEDGWIDQVAGLSFSACGVVIPLPNEHRATQPLPEERGGAIDWGTTVFGWMGIPHRYGNPVARDEVVAMNEQTVSYLEDGEIDWYLKGACLLDGGAAEALARRGFGKMIGVEAKPRTEVAPGFLFFANAEGGRIATFASRLAPEQHLGRNDWYNETRKRALVATLRRLGGGALPGGVAYAGDAEISCLAGTAADGRRIVVLDNLNLDDIANPELLADHMPDRALRLSDDGTWTPVLVVKTARGFAPVVTIRTYRPEVLSFSFTGAGQSRNGVCPNEE